MIKSCISSKRQPKSSSPASHKLLDLWAVPHGLLHRRQHLQLCYLAKAYALESRVPTSFRDLVRGPCSTAAQQTPIIKLKYHIWYRRHVRAIRILQGALKRKCHLNGSLRDCQRHGLSEELENHQWARTAPDGTKAGTQSSKNHVQCD